MGKLEYGLIGFLLLGVVGFLIWPNFKPAPRPQVEVGQPVASNKLENDESPPAAKIQPGTHIVIDEIDSGLVGKKLANNYFEFVKQDLLELKELNKPGNRPLLLYFYANWCPTCAVQEPIMIDFMNSGGSLGAVALRVNYNDSGTDADEKALAKEFTITYQHTFVLLDANGKVVTEVNGLQSDNDLRNLFAKI